MTTTTTGTRHIVLEETPVGALLIVARDETVSGLYMLQGKHSPDREAAGPRGSDSFLQNVGTQLREYFGGERTEFDLAVDAVGTPFQRTVWDQLSTIDYGTTWTYGQLARAIGQPTASRAVGLANGRNPVSIIVPCHRVIGADGSLTGYGGGIENKKTLLRLEGSVVGSTLF